MPTEFGERLKELRTEKGLTLEELATAIGSTKSYVWELENKPNIRPSIETAYKLAAALDTTVAILMGEKDPADPEEKDAVFFRNFQQLSPTTKKQLHKILDALKDEK